MNSEENSTSPLRVARFGPFELHPVQRLLTREGTSVALGSRALDILISLVDRHGEVVSRRDLLAAAWPGLTVEESNLRFHISGLRKVLGDGIGEVRYVDNVIGRGYCFVAPVSWSAPDAPMGSSAQPEQSGVAHLRRLPALSTRVIGRSGAVDELADLVLEKRFVSIVATGGIGKTTTALATAHHLLNKRDDGAVFIDLSAVTDSAGVASAIASALGLSVQGGDIMAAVAAHVAERSPLFVLDNCEHVAEAAATACERLIDGIENSRILVTSREPLRARGEHIYFLEPLDLPPEDTPVTLTNAMATAAVELFMERAVASGYRTPLDDTDAGHVVEICRRLDGIALAIELAASRAGTFGIDGVLDLLGQQPELLWQGRRGATPRHQTLQAMMDWSFNLLSPLEQRVLIRLSVFGSPFTLKAAQAVACDCEDEILDVANALTGLVDKSIISSSFGSSPVSFRLLETMQAYTAAKLADDPAYEDVALRHCQFQIRRLEEDDVADAMFDGRDLTGYANQMAGIRSALAWAEARDDQRDLFVRLAALSAPIFLRLSLFSVHDEWCRKGLEALTEDLGGTVIELLLLEGFANGAMFASGNRLAVQDAIKRGLAIAKQINLTEHRLHLLAGENIFLTRIGDFGAAAALTESSVALTQGAVTPQASAMVYWMRGVSLHLAGNQAEALEFMEKGFEQVPIRSEVAVDYFGFDHRVRALVAYARALWLTGDTGKAMEMAHEAVACADRQKRPVSVCIALIYSTTVAIWSGSFDIAEMWIDRLIALAQRYSLLPYFTVAEGLRGQLSIARGDPAGGVADLVRTIAQCQAEEHHILTVALQDSLAEGYRALGNFGQARLTINAAVKAIEASGGNCDSPGLCLTAAAVELSADSDPAIVQAWLERAIRAAREQSAFHIELRAGLKLAEIYKALGKPAEATALLSDILARAPGGHDVPEAEQAKAFLDSGQS